MLSLPFASNAYAQQTIGTVNTAHATVTGQVSITQEQAQIGNNGTVKSGAQSAEIALTRGGNVTVCMGSTVQLSQGNSTHAPLLLSLNHGAFEVRMDAGQRDVLMTPDLRIDLSNAAPLDLNISVTAEGDTCIDNRGKQAPILHLSQQFGAGGYFVKPGQHILLEHGSTREVVDNEKSSCGCPPPPRPGDPHPFPEAISQGLAPSAVPQASVGETHTQVGATLSYNGSDTGQAQAPAPAAATPSTASTPQLQAPSQSHNPFAALARFFKHLFGG